MIFWYWIALGLGLMALEIALPSYFFLWLGAAALAVGGIVFFIPAMETTVQLSLFAVLGLVAFYLSRQMMKRKKTQWAEGPRLNKRSAAMVGRIVTLESAIENGQGKAKIGDTLWSVEGPALPAGTSVRIIAADGMSLQVEKSDLGSKLN